MKRNTVQYQQYFDFFFASLFASNRWICFWIFSFDARIIAAPATHSFMQHLRARSDSMLKINKKKLYRFVYSSVSLLQSQEIIALTAHLAIVYQQNKKSLIEGHRIVLILLDEAFTA